MPYWTRAEIERGSAPLAGKVLVYVEDPVEAFFLQIQGSGRVKLADGSVMRVGYADQNGHPYRSIGRVLIDRGELTLDRASMQGIREWGRRHPDKLAGAARRKSELRVLPRSARAAPGHARRGHRRARIGALGVPLLARPRDRRRPALDPARRAGVPRDDVSAVDATARAAGARAGHGRRDPRRGARRFLLGLRRRGGPRGGADAAGRRDVAAVAATDSRRGAALTVVSARVPCAHALRGCTAQGSAAASGRREDEPESPMTVARITEISSVSKKSFEDADPARHRARPPDAAQRRRRLGQGPGSADQGRQATGFKVILQDHLRASD